MTPGGDGDARVELPVHVIMLFNLAVLAAAFVQFAATCAANEAFFVTAIVTNAQNNSALECWGKFVSCQ